MTAGAGPRRAPEIDLRVRRTYLYADPIPHACPRCAAPLVRSHQTYFVDTRDGSGATESFVMGASFGAFCPDCPTVVVDPGDVGDMLAHALPAPKLGSEFALLGLVDLDAVPEEKRHLALGSEDNPIALIPFDFGGSIRQARSHKNKHKRRKKR